MMVALTKVVASGMETRGQISAEFMRLNQQGRGD